ncbi:hypothetical protein, partial [Yersinia massiliensis]|uniref:hypothetical protein n=1 Tax=Yersinia massiliensis TaxID=419257 RepID=UPI001C937F21
LFFCFCYVFFLFFLFLFVFVFFWFDVWGVLFFSAVFLQFAFLFADSALDPEGLLLSRGWAASGLRALFNIPLCCLT